jgi:hypothetical protein
MDTKPMTTVMKTLSSLVLIILACSLTPALAANRSPDIEHGKSLHEAKCMGCHDNRQYTRPNRIIHTFEDLRARVEFCDSASNANFSFNDLDDVVEYLNVNFYKFKK